VSGTGADDWRGRELLGGEGGLPLQPSQCLCTRWRPGLSMVQWWACGVETGMVSVLRLLCVCCATFAKKKRRK